MKNQRKKLNVGLYGQYGHQIMGILYNHTDAQISAICDIGDYFANEIIASCKNEVKVYSSLEEMLEDDTIDIISLCSRNREKQADEAIMCLKAKKHVYAEKPAALTEAKLDEILQCAIENEREFHEMADSIFIDPYWQMKSIVQNGTIGEVVQVYVQKSYRLNIDNRPQDENVDGGLVRQAGIHGVRFLEHITGLKVKEVKAISTHLGNTTPDGGLTTASSWIMSLENGGVASACVNYLNPNSFPKWGNETVRIFGTKGMAEITDGGENTHLYTDEEDKGGFLIENYECPDFFTLLLKHLIYGDPMPMTLDDELHPLRVVIRAYESGGYSK